MTLNTSSIATAPWVNPYGSKTKAHQIGELLRQGKTNKFITKKLGMKTPSRVSKIKRDVLQIIASMPEPPDGEPSQLATDATEDDEESAKPVVVGGDSGKRTLPVLTGNGGAAPLGSGLGADALPLRPTEQLGGDGGKTMPLGLPLRPGEAVISVSGIAPGRTIQINPKILTMHQWLCASTDYNGDIGDFLNDTAEYFFRVNNYVMKIVKEEIIE